MGRDLPVGVRGDWRDQASYRKRPQPPAIVFVRVADERVVKNRVHLDIWPVKRTRDEPVAALLGRGATLADLGQQDVG